MHSHLGKILQFFFKWGVKSRFLTFIRIFGFFWLFLASFCPPFFWLFSTLGPDRYYLRKGLRKKPNLTWQFWPKFWSVGIIFFSKNGRKLVFFGDFWNFFFFFEKMPFLGDSKKKIGYFWQILATFEIFFLSFWDFLAIFWKILAIFENFWLPLKFFGYFWKIKATFENLFFKKFGSLLRILPTFEFFSGGGFF